MTTTQIRTKILTAGVSAVIATMAAPALLMLGAGAAQATPDISIPAFNPQPDPPGDTESDSSVGSPEDKSDSSVGSPEDKSDSSLGGPDTKVDGGTRVDPHDPNGPERASSSLNPGETVGIILHG